ncbi:hypothetical protein AC20117_01100 [Arthrobacter crystallopoietes]|nr:hypothetical protein AC20117_01100 [Arthrobacter crystallopoietes]
MQPESPAHATGVQGSDPLVPPLEDLGSLAGGQGYFSSGPWLSADAAEVLLDSASRASARFGRTAALRRPDIAHEFTSWGFTNPRGSYTADTEFFRHAVRAAQTRARIDGWYLGKRTSLRLWIGGRWTAVVAGTSAGALLHGYESGNRGTMVQLDVAGVDDAASVMAAWSGLAPAWSVAGTAGTIDTINRSLFERRLQDARVPAPANAEGPLLRLWREPWFVWLASIGRGRFRRGFINAGTAGHFLFGVNNDGDVQLAQQSSSLLWHTLRDAVEDARFQERHY